MTRMLKNDTVKFLLTVIRSVKVSYLQTVREKKSIAQDPWRPLDRKVEEQTFRTISSDILYSEIRRLI